MITYKIEEVKSLSKLKFDDMIEGFIIRATYTHHVDGIAQFLLERKVNSQWICEGVYTSTLRSVKNIINETDLKYLKANHNGNS
jgi:hypothetical protein